MKASILRCQRATTSLARFKKVRPFLLERGQFFRSLYLAPALSLCPFPVLCHPTIPSHSRLQRESRLSSPPLPHHRRCTLCSLHAL